MRRFAVVLGMTLAAGAGVWAAGTVLSIAFDEPSVTCPDGNVSAGYTVSTTAADGAAVTETLTNSSNTPVASHAYSIPAGSTPEGWTFAGRTKTHDGLFQTNGLVDGTYSLQVCVTQAGSGGNPDKTVCSTETIVVACAEQTLNACASTALHGEVTGNDKITDHSTAQITFRGDFGPSALVEISGPNFYTSATIGKNGESCEYHANWKFTTDDGSDLFGSNGAGVYAVKVTGNNKTLDFSVTLSD
jgi:hypothetical protein